MHVLLVNGSPHEKGICRLLLDGLLEGLKDAGADAELVNLSTVTLRSCRACDGARCWTEMECNIEDDALELRKAFNKCDALAIAAPVYFLSVNSLTKNFIDRMRNYRQDIRPSAAIAVAGGTGKGCITALQEICRWMTLVGFYPLVAEPVTRYNLDVVIGRARSWGKMLIERPSEVSQRSSLYDKLLAFERLPYMHYTVVDEVLYLASSAIEAVARMGASDKTAELARTLEMAETTLRLGYLEEGLKLAVDAHEGSMDLFNKIRNAV